MPLLRLTRFGYRKDLFEHLVGEQDEGIWQLEPDRFGTFEVHDQLIAGWQFERQIGGPAW
jgi:hypothetical protein